MGVDGASSTRRSSRERVQTAKTGGLEQRRGKRDRDDIHAGEIDDTIVVTSSMPSTNIVKRTNISSQAKDQVVAAKVRALPTKAGESPSSTAANGTHLEKENLADMVRLLLRTMEDQRKEQTLQIEALQEAHTTQIRSLTETFTRQMQEIKAEIADMAEKIQNQVSGIQIPSASPSYATVARTPPDSQAGNVRNLSSMNTTSPSVTETLYCTVDTSRVEEGQKSQVQPGMIRKAIEEEIRTVDGRANWRCAAVIRDARNVDRIKVVCRDEIELQRVKEVAQKKLTTGARVLRDQLYPIKVDNAKRLAVLDRGGQVLPEAAEALGEENEVHIAKIAWLSKKDTGKAYGSMVIYVTKASEAARLLQGQYFHVAGESAYTRTFEHRQGPQQCYRCQELGHKAYSCTKVQVCARCAKQGHHHSGCHAEIPRCALCQGPHEAFSKVCRALYPPTHV
jgi:hypothetical protein